jgi:hypothetical protein
MLLRWPPPHQFSGFTPGGSLESFLEGSKGETYPFAKCRE